MDIFPAVTASRFVQIEIGTLFLSLDRERFFALKTAPITPEEQPLMLCLGPTFPADIQESALMNGERTNLLSFGKDFSVLLPSDPAAWVPEAEIRHPDVRRPVHLAVYEGVVFVCANASEWEGRYAQCFVDLSSGSVTERLPGRAVYTNRWQIAIIKPHYPPRMLVSYPLNPVV